MILLLVYCQVFNKSQEAEEKRLEFFKEMMFGIHKCLEPSSYPKLVQYLSFIKLT